MHKGRVNILIFLSFSLLLLLFPSMKVQAVFQSDENEQVFLEWYEEHKNINFSTYRLQGDLHLSSGSEEQPIMLDGSGVLDLECNGFSIYIESNVVINHPKLYITTNRKAEGPLLILKSKDSQTNAKLSLQQGGIYGEQIGLQIISGELKAPLVEKQFNIVAGSDGLPAIDNQTANITLYNLDVSSSGSGKIIAIQAKQDISLENCNIQMDIEDNASKGFGVYAGGKVQLKNTSINVQGMKAQSVQSDLGVKQISIDEQSSVKPEIELNTNNISKYQMVNLSSPTYLNVPLAITMDQLDLPSTIACGLENLLDPTQPIKTMDISVAWDTTELAACLNTLGECTILGSLSQSQLDQEGIAKQASLQPRIRILVVPANAMNKIQIASIRPDAPTPFLEVYLLDPHGASQFQLQYSNDGNTWETGYCVREDQSRVTNLLECNDPVNGYLLTNIYFTKLEEGGMVRTVVNGGAFAGSSERVLLDMENLFTKPGEDGGGGNRGGSGQWEGERSEANAQEEDEDDIPSLSRPSNIASEEVIREAGTKSSSPLPYILIMIISYGCYLLHRCMLKYFTNK